jgi:hypothetical protein
MSPSDHAQIPTDRLRDVGDRLKELGQELHPINAGLKLLEGEDDIHGHKVAQAVQGFHERNLEARKRRIKATIDFGDFTIRIANATDKLDGDMADAYRQELHENAKQIDRYFY